MKQALASGERFQITYSRNGYNLAIIYLTSMLLEYFPVIRGGWLHMKLQLFLAKCVLGHQDASIKKRSFKKGSNLTFNETSKTLQI
jgi:uncharacterized membrane protein